MFEKYQPFIQNDLFEGIVSRKEFLELNKEGYFNRDPEKIAVISIFSPDNMPINIKQEGFDNYIAVGFWDIEDNIGPYKIISEDIANRIKNFILQNKDKKFLIHCDAGMSRSAGVGLAVECLIKHNGDKYQASLEPSEIYQYRRYSPNLTVRDKILEASLKNQDEQDDTE